MSRSEASINDVPISEFECHYFGPCPTSEREARHYTLVAMSSLATMQAGQCRELQLGNRVRVFGHTQLSTCYASSMRKQGSKAKEIIQESRKQ